MSTAKSLKLDAETIKAALGTLSNDADLAAIRDACDVAIQANKSRRMQEVRARIAAMAADSGLTLDDIIGSARAKRTPREVIKGKRHTKAMFDPVINKRWAGVGRMPLGFDPKRAVASS